jgi:NADH-quinone oxidoreductase subunit C
MAGTLEQLGTTLGAALPGAQVTHAFGELTIEVELAQWIATITHLRDAPDCQFINFIDLTAVDWPAREKRFDVVVHLLSPHHNLRIRAKTRAGETDLVPSLVGVFPCADWFEREVYDLFGVLFSGHPDLRRILTDYGFDGHPLRKDFPMTGFVEVRWDDEQKRVVNEPVRLNQEFRQFDFLSPWEGVRYDLPGDEKAKGQ